MPLKKIKILKHIADSQYNFSPGEIVEVPEEIANHLCAKNSYVMGEYTFDNRKAISMEEHEAELSSIRNPVVGGITVVETPKDEVYEDFLNKKAGFAPFSEVGDQEQVSVEPDFQEQHETAPKRRGRKSKTEESVA